MSTKFQCGLCGGVKVSYVPMFKIATKALLGYIFCLPLVYFQMRLLCGSAKYHILEIWAIFLIM